MTTLQDVVLKMTLHAVETAQIGREAIIGELIGTGLTPEEAQTAIDDVILVRLTPAARQTRMPALIDAGLSNRQIAAALGVDEKTVRKDRADKSAPPSTTGADKSADDDPAVAPPVTKKEKPLDQRQNLTEVRRQTKGILMSLTLLRPGEVIPPAFPVVREFAQALIQWANENWPANGETPDA